MDKSPFHIKQISDDPLNPKIHIATGNGAYQNTRDILAGLDITSSNGKRVLLKPNIGRIAAPESGINTHPQVVAAAIDAFMEAGAIVSVGESPITGVNTIEAFESSGIASVVQDRGCMLLDMDNRQAVKVAVKNGVVIKSLKVCPDVLDHDIVVSIPVMKTHMHTGVTLSVKNMKGCLWKRSKVDLHMLPPIKGIDDLPLNIAIADMSSVLRPHLSIIDGTVGMEGMGPSGGRAKKLDVIVAGVDPFAADAVACSLMGFNAQDVPHLRIAAERGYGIIDISKIDIRHDSWRDLISPFEPSPDNLSINFPGIAILDKQSCSACQSTLLMFLKHYEKHIFDYFPGQKNIIIAMGKGHKSVPRGTLCIGNCVVKHKKKGIFVSGCPPVASQIIKILSERT